MKRRYFLIYCCGLLAIFFAFFYFSSPALAEKQIFQNVLIKDNPSSPYLFLSVVIFSLLSVSAILFLLGRKFLPTLPKNMIKSISETQEVERLVKAFYKMAKTIESRDKSLLSDKRKAEKNNKEKSDFLLNISHELRTPMHAILNFAEMSRDKVVKNETDKVPLYLSRIEESGERLLELINRILDLTRLELREINLKYEKQDILDCLESSLSGLGSLVDIKKLNIKIDKKTNDLNVVFDSARISQLFVNLLSNAIKFTPDNKNIFIKIEESLLPVTGGKSVQSILISITNDGTSIPESELERIFYKFVQSRSHEVGMGGSGIGLAICREIVNLHAGKIWAENVSDGVCFSFCIPRDCTKIIEKMPKLQGESNENTSS